MPSVSYTYGADGPQTAMTLGNGLVETSTQNWRGQVTGIGLGTRWSLVNQYGTANNNGNLRKQTISAPEAGLSVFQVYAYDGVNRLQTAAEYTTPRETPQCADAGSVWCIALGYGQWGNRLVTARTGLTAGFTEPASYNGQNQMNSEGWDYDGRGNLKKDPMGATYLYDAEDRQVASCLADPDGCVKVAGSQRTLYDYDGEGRRVRKTDATGGTTIYAYDAMGRLGVEYATLGSSVSGRQYLTADHLGSTRVVTDAAGAVLERRDYRPFGDEITVSPGNPRYGIAGYGSYGGTPLKFTGKERDQQTGLDYFGARYFSGAQGRFTSPDQPFNDQHPADPQSWNLYSYVRNNPLVNIDPTGEDCVYTNNYNSDGTVTVERGNCSNKGGTFVDGTIDTKSFVVRNGNLDFGYTSANGAAGVHSMGLPSAPDLGLMALQRGTRLAEPGVNLAAAGTAAVMVGAFTGVAYGAIAGGSALTNLAIFSMPAVPSALQKLQKIGLSLQQAVQIVSNPASQKLIDTANGNNINVIQQVGDKLVRITLDPTGQRIISAGYVQGRNVANSIASGRFIKK